MLIMTLAYAQRADDTDYLSEHYSMYRCIHLPLGEFDLLQPF